MTTGMGLPPWQGLKENEWSEPVATPIHTAEDVGPDLIEKAYECADSTDGVGYRWGIDWKLAYDTLEMYGWSLEEFDSPADRKIRREVNKRRKVEGLSIKEQI